MYDVVIYCVDLAAGVNEVVVAYVDVLTHVFDHLKFRQEILMQSLRSGYCYKHNYIWVLCITRIGHKSFNTVRMAIISTMLTDSMRTLTRYSRINNMGQCNTKYVFHVYTMDTCFILCCKTWHSNPPISQFNSPCNEYWQKGA